MTAPPTRRGRRRTPMPADERVRRGRRVPPGEREPLAAKLAADYQDGASLRALAAGSGWSFSTIRQLIKEAGVQLRPPGGHRRRQ